MIESNRILSGLLLNIQNVICESISGGSSIFGRKISNSNILEMNLNTFGQLVNDYDTLCLCRE
jgi:hypothetical protein